MTSVKRVWLPAAALCVSLVAVACPLVWSEEVPPKAVELKTTRDQASYAIGMNIGRSMKSEGLDINVAAMVLGMTDALGDRQAKLTPQQLQAAMVAFNEEMTKKMAERAKAVGEKNKKEGAAFLTANKAKPGVVTLPSGLQYQVLKSGKGPSPTREDRVKTHYHGTLISGEVFDSSVERGEPITFPVGGVIRGWTEALLKMKVGDKWRLFVPSELAYGDQGTGPVIGPHALLIFEVELLAIEKQ